MTNYFREYGIGFLIVAVPGAVLSAEFVQVSDPPPSSAVAAQSSLSKVVVAGKSAEERARDNAAGRSVIDGEDLRRFGDVNVPEALQRIPGVTLSNGKPQLRGLNAGYTQILVDGQPPSLSVNISTIPLSLIDRVEIYRTATAEFSTQAIAGTINIVLKHLPQQTQQQVQFSIANEYRPNAAFDWQTSKSIGDFAGSLSLNARWTRSAFAVPITDLTSYFSNDGLLTRQIAHTSTPDSIDRGVSALARGQWKVNDKTNLTSATTLSASHSNSALDERFEAITGTPETFANSSRDATRNTASISSNLQMVSRLSSGAKLDLTAGGSASVQRSSAVTTGEDIAYHPAILIYIDSQVKRYTAGTTGKWSFPRAGEHDVVGGWSASYAGAITQSDRVNTNPTTGISSTFPQDDTAKVQNVALFIQDQWDIDKLASLYLGARWEAVNLQVDSVQSGFVSNKASVVSPIVQSLWKLENKQDQIRLGIARTYKAPLPLMLITPREIQLNNSVVNANFRGNPYLKPELAWSLEASFEHAKKDGIEFSARTYFRRIADLHRLVRTNQDNLWEVSYVNFGSARSVGLEGDVRIPLKYKNAAAPDIELRANFAKIRSVVEGIPGPDNSLEPSLFNVTVGADLKAKTSPIAAGISFRFSNGGWQTQTLQERSYTSPGRSMSAYASGRIDKATQIRLSGSNLLRRRTISRKQYIAMDETTIYEATAKSYAQVRVMFEHKY